MGRNRRHLRRRFLNVLVVVLLASTAASGDARAQNIDPEVAKRIEDLRAEARAEASRREITDFVSDNFWETPAGRRHMARLRREAFVEAMSRFAELGAERWETRYDERQRRIVLEHERMAEDLGNAVEDIADYIEREYRLEDIEVATSAVDGPVDERIRTIQSAIRDVLPGIMEIVGGEVLDAVKFVEVRESLARIAALAESLHD